MSTPPKGPSSETVRRHSPRDGHIAHALNVAIVQLQNAEEMMIDGDARCAIAQLEIIQAIVARLCEGARRLDSRPKGAPRRP
jgi:hypothetical protein